ncbi:MAG: hypothetical protein IBX47_08670 [Desulfuromonadales bacterium]|nr:hypothetical protein [Desulfuromonadales bacterium]
MEKKICYCFNFTKRAIIVDLQLHCGRSTIVEQILKAQQEGECRCSETHPEGR